MKDAAVHAELRERQLDGPRLVAVDRDHRRVGTSAPVVHHETTLALDLIERAAAERRDRLPQRREVACELANGLVAASPRHRSAVIGIGSARECDLRPVIEDGRAGHGEEVYERLLEARDRRGVRRVPADEPRHVMVVDEDRATVLVPRAEVGRERG